MMAQCWVKIGRSASAPLPLDPPLVCTCSYCFGNVNAINKLWVSLCLPIHWEFENLCFILKSVLKLQLLFNVAVMKKFMEHVLCVVDKLIKTHNHISHVLLYKLWLRSWQHSWNFYVVIVKFLWRYLSVHTIGSMVVMVYVMDWRFCKASQCKKTFT